MSIDETSILVIDDDPVSRELLQLLLRREGYLLSIADSGSHALDNLRTPGIATPRVILADLQMPGITGTHLAAALREICGEELVLIAMSASVPDEEAIRDYDAFLLKPFTMEQFAAAIRSRRAVQITDPAIRADVPVLAIEVFRKLSESMPPETLEKLYLFCLEDTDKRLHAMHQAAAQGDDAGYRRQAHAIKGGCGMVGAHELQSIATKMEKTGLTANHLATFDEFLLASERLKRMLNAHEIAVR